jgi:hypothetical protein
MIHKILFSMKTQFSLLIIGLLVLTMSCKKLPDEYEDKNNTNGFKPPKAENGWEYIGQASGQSREYIRFVHAQTMSTGTDIITRQFFPTMSGGYWNNVRSFIGNDKKLKFDEKSTVTNPTDKHLIHSYPTADAMFHFVTTKELMYSNYSSTSVLLEDIGLGNFDGSLSPDNAFVMEAGKAKVLYNNEPHLIFPSMDADFLAGKVMSDHTLVFVAQSKSWYNKNLLIGQSNREIRNTNFAGTPQKWWNGEVFNSIPIKELSGGADDSKIITSVWNYNDSKIYLLLYFSNEKYSYLEIDINTFEVKNLPHNVSLIQTGQGTERFSYICSDGTIITGLDHFFKKDKLASVKKITSTSYEEIVLPEVFWDERFDLDDWVYMSYTLYAKYDKLYFGLNVPGSGFYVYKKDLL